MSWQILIGISLLSYSFSFILQRFLMTNKKADAISYSIFTQLYSAGLFFIFALFHGFHMPNFGPYLVNVGIMILCFSLLNILAFNAFRYIQASEFTILFMTNGLWTVLTAIAFLGESFSLQQVMGAILIAIGVILVTIKKEKFVFNKGVWFTLGAAFCLGVGFANNAYMSRSFDAASFLVFSYGLPGLVTALVFPKAVAKGKFFLQKKNFLLLSLLAFVYALNGITYLTAYQVGHNAAQLGVIIQTQTIVTVLLSIVILKETSNLWKKFLGTIIGFIGVLLTK